jgi:hypothetical protein
MSAFDDLERSLSVRCKEMRESSERILGAIDSGILDLMPETAEHLRRLALNTLEAVERYEHDRDTCT